MTGTELVNIREWMEKFLVYNDDDHHHHLLLLLVLGEGMLGCLISHSAARLELTMCLRLALNLWFISCFSLQSAETTSLSHHTWLNL